MPNLQVHRPADFVEFPRAGIFQGIHQKIEQQARLYPEKPALRTPRLTYSYREMNGLANSLAKAILAQVGPALAQAAILQANTPEVIVSLLGALKAHKAYVPLDPGFPKERLKIMFADASPIVLVTDDQNLALARELAGDVARIVNVSEIPRHADEPNPDVPCDPMDTAYILFTSGSTGRPKGIEFLHRNLLHHTMGLVNALSFSPGDRVTWLHSSSFAASIVDIYCCLMAGGTLYPWDVKTQGFIGMADWLVAERVTTFQWIPSAFRQFLRTVPEDFVFRDIRLVVMASESLTAREAELFRRHFPAGSHLVNQVGTSEAGNYRLYAVDHEIPIEGVHVPGGYAPNDERNVLILDDQQKPLPAGTTGEIGVQSDYMCRGYWRDDEMTRAKFIYIGPNSAPVYLTGDLGRIEPDGCLIHLGRKDSQVKIRGYRVELAEVEHVLASAPGVADGAACVLKNRLGEDELVAYVVLKESARLDQKALEEHMESRLPGYMAPRHYVAVDRLPTLPTGKTDRKSLPNPFAQAATQTAAPEISSASALGGVTALFAELLQQGNVRADTNFLDAGGDSLLVAVLLQRVSQSFSVRIAVADFLESPTPSHLAALIGRGSSPVQPVAAPAVQARVAATRTARARSSSAIQDLLIISAGGFGREVYSWARQAMEAGAAYRVKGFLDSRAKALDGFDYDVPVFDPATYEIQENDVFVGALGDPKDKMRFYGPLAERGARFVNVIHPTVNIGRNARLGAGIVVGPYSALNADITIGDHVAIGTFSNVGHDAVVGSWCHVASHCGVNGRVLLGDAVFMGSHSCVVPGTTVGDGAFVGAGSVVVRNVAPGMKMFGNPAEIIGVA